MQTISSEFRECVAVGVEFEGWLSYKFVMLCSEIMHYCEYRHCKAPSLCVQRK